MHSPQQIFMNALFPIGEVPHFPSIQPAATQFSDGMELSDGVREAAKNGAPAPPPEAADPAADPNAKVLDCIQQVAPANVATHAAMYFTRANPEESVPNGEMAEMPAFFDFAAASAIL